MSVSLQLVLVVDIGGINVCFVLVDILQDVFLQKDSICEYVVVEFFLLGDVVCYYLEQIGVIVSRGVFVVVGCVDGDEVCIINYLWVILCSCIVVMFGFDELYLINDFVVQVMVILLLQFEDVVQVGGVVWVLGKLGQLCNYVVIGLGIGFGVGGLIMCYGCCYLLEIEGGYVSFLLGILEEICILEILFEQFGCVFNECLICGFGLVNIYCVVCEMVGIDLGQLQLVDVIVCVLYGDLQVMCIVDVFCVVFGVIVGDLVFIQGVWDGVFLIGGLILKMFDLLQYFGFCQCFEYKGCFFLIMVCVFLLVVMYFYVGLLGVVVYVIDVECDVLGVVE